MDIQVERNWSGPGYCASNVYIDGKLFCQGIEDVERTYNGKPLEKSMGDAVIRSVKVAAQTAIPRGKYSVALTHSAHFAGKEPYRSVSHGIVPLVVGVPGYVGIRIHCGNTAADSAGCLLLGENPGDINKGRNQNSAKTWTAFWNIVKDQSNITITYTGKEGAVGLSAESMENVISTGGSGRVGIASYRLPECPPDIEFKRLWNMYREKSKVIRGFGSPGSPGYVGNIAGYGGDVSGITDEMVAYLGLETKEGALFLLNSISQFEGGLRWSDPFGQKELHGYGDTGDNPGHHRTYAFGMLYDPDSGRYMDEVVPPGGWTEDVLRRKFLKLCAKHVAALKGWKTNNNVNISEEWFVALCHLHHWSPSVPNGHSDPYWDCLSNPFRWLAGDFITRQKYPGYADALWSIFTTPGKAGGERRFSKYFPGWKKRNYDFQLEHAR